MTSEEVLKNWRPELIDYLKEMYEFRNNPDIGEILMMLGQMSARASLMRNLCMRSSNNDIIRFRLDEIDPFINEVDRQYKIYSRLLSANQFELDLTK